MRNWINLFEGKLTEAVIEKVKLPRAFAFKEVMVWKNPSLHEVDALVQSDIMRGLVDDVNVFIWKSNLCIHDTMANALAESGLWTGEMTTRRAGTPDEILVPLLVETSELYFYDSHNGSQCRWVNYDDDLPSIDLDEGLRMSAYTASRFDIVGMPAMLKRLFRKVVSKTNQLTEGQLHPALPTMHGQEPWWTSPLHDLTNELSTIVGYDDPWRTGGCFAFAEALQSIYGGSLWSACMRDDDGDWSAEHAVVKLDGRFYDYYGVFLMEDYRQMLISEHGWYDDVEMAMIEGCADQDNLLNHSQWEKLLKILGGGTD